MRQRLQAWLFVAGLVVLASSTLRIGSAQTPTPAPTPETTTEEEAAQAAEVPLVIPPEASRRKNPIAADEASLDKGRQLFAAQCTMCHGSNGDGKGDVGVQLNMRVPDLRNTAVRKTKTDGDVFFVVSAGHGNMPKSARLSEDFRWHLVNYVRSLSADPKRAAD